MVKKFFSSQKGLSVLEIVLAVAFFFIFASGAVVSLLQALDANRLAVEQAVATQYAVEGIEAVKSVKNQDFSNLLETNSTGLTRNLLGFWQFEGQNNIFNNGKNYIRNIRISPVNRDLNGMIVPAPTGYLDPFTKKVVVNVNWNFNFIRDEVVDLATYVTDWKRSITHAILIFGDSTNSPKLSDYNYLDDTFSDSVSTVTGSIGRVFRIRTSPLKKEAVAAYVDSSGTLQVMCFNGFSWINEWRVLIGGSGQTVKFDIAYETNSGDVIVVYSKEKQGANAISFQTKPGNTGCGINNWTAASSLPGSPRLTNGVVDWIRAESSPITNSNRVVTVWSDNSSRLGAAAWDGNSWSSLPKSLLETKLERVSTDSDVPSFDLAYESQTGALITAWGVLTTNKACNPDSNCIKFSRFDGNNWSEPLPITNVAGSATNMDLSSNSSTNEIIMGAIDNGPNDANLNRLSIGYWSGSSWIGNAANTTNTNSPQPGTKLVATGWLMNKAIVTYNHIDSVNVNWYVCNGGSCTTQPAYSPSSALGNPQKWYEIETDPFNVNQLMLTISDTNNQLFAKRLTLNNDLTFSWSDSDNNHPIEASLTQSITSPFSFSYWHVR